jgi:PIN domain nuclease of toxin-antitoxin system
MPYIVDTSAVLAYFFKESGYEELPELFGECIISSVNLGEVIAKFHDKNYGAEKIGIALGSFEIEVVPFDREQAIDTGHLRPLTRHLGLSFGDRACLSLAKFRGLPVLTADRTWATLNVGVEIKLIR